MDKELSKRLFRSVGVPTANWLMAPAKADDVARSLNWPVIGEAEQAGLHGRPEHRASLVAAGARN